MPNLVSFLSSTFLTTVILVLGSQRVDGQPPECKAVQSLDSFDFMEYISAKWFAQEQRPGPFQPVSQNFCTTAQYSLINESGEPNSNGYAINVLNIAQDAEGNVFTSNDPGLGPLCGGKNVFPGDKDSELTVGLCPVPVFAFGDSNYWVVAYDEEDGYALISGGQPDVPTSDGLCSYSNPNAGLWIFSRCPEPNYEMISKYRQIARDNGIDPTVLNPVNHQGCNHQSINTKQCKGKKGKKVKKSSKQSKKPKA